MSPNKKITTSKAMLLAASFLFIPVTSMANGKIGVGTGFDYSSGDYGGTGDTTILFIPFTAKYKTENYAVKITIPYIQMESDDGNVVGGGSDAIVVNSGTGNSNSTTESGLGDIILKGTYFLYEGVENNPLVPAVDLSAKIKFPTADEEKGLGTGKADFALESDFTWFTDKYAIFTTLGYKFMGSNETYDLNDVAYASIGGTYQIKKALSVGLIHDFKEATTNSGSIMNEVTGYINYKLSDQWKFLFYVVKGFSDGSADYGTGAIVSFTMDADKIDWWKPEINR